VENYESAVSAYLSLKKATSLCRHPIVVGQQKAACTEQIKLSLSCLAMVYTNLDALHERHRSIIQRITDLEETLRLAQEEESQLNRDVKAKSLELPVVESEVDVKSKALADLEVVPNWSPDDVMELERHKQVMLAMPTSLNHDLWTDSA